MPPSKTAELLNELPADDRTSFLEELPNNAVRELIKLLDNEERKITLSLLGYPENSVGRLMTPDYVYVYERYTVPEVLEIIRRVGQNSETIDVIYVINQRCKRGCLTLSHRPDNKKEPLLLLRKCFKNSGTL